MPQQLQAGGLAIATRTATRRQPSRKTFKLDRTLPLLRTSERGTMKACEFRWTQTYGAGLEPMQAAPALRFGSLVHAALAVYYKPGIKRGPKPASTFTKLYEEQIREADKMGFRDESEQWVNAAELGVGMLENYIDEYGADDEWEVLVTECPFQALVRHPDTGRPWFTYVGVVDGVWRYRPNSRIWVPDHKTTKSLGGTSEHPKIPPYLMMDDASSAYWGYGVVDLMKRGIIPKDTKIAGMLFNFLRKALPDERPYRIVKRRRIYLNKDGSVSKKQPPPHFLRQQIMRDEYEREYAKTRAQDDFMRIEKLRSGEVNPTKSPGMFTCNMCSVRDVCELHETGNDYESVIAAIMQPWDPYEQHEIYEGR